MLICRVKKMSSSWLARKTQWGFICTCRTMHISTKQTALSTHTPGHQARLHLLGNANLLPSLTRQNADPSTFLGSLLSLADRCPKRNGFQENDSEWGLTGLLCTGAEPLGHNSPSQLRSTEVCSFLFAPVAFVPNPHPYPFGISDRLVLSIRWLSE